MNETHNGWMIPTDPYENNKHKFRKHRNRGISFRVYICRYCNRVHETGWHNGRGGHVFYHEEFPRYGLDIKDCKNCDG